MKKLKLTGLAMPESAVLTGSKEVLTYHEAVKLWWRNNVGRGYVIRPRSGEDYTWLRLQLERCVRNGYLDKGQYRWIEWGAPGSGDLLGMLHGGRFLSNECKSASGKLTDDQVIWMDRVNEGGGLALCTRSPTELNNALSDAIR